jgi:hypothetical protein
MVEYFYSNENYEKLLLTDTNTSTEFIQKYISGINYPGFTRYLVSENIGYTTKGSYLSSKLRGKKININHAAEYGYPELVKYLYDRGVKATEDDINEAVENGHLEVVKYLYKKGLKADQYSINQAVKTGHLEVVKYLYKKGLKATERSIDHAVKNGHLEVVKYLRSVTLYKKGVKSY